jgi:hypothetical protein
MKKESIITANDPTIIQAREEKKDRNKDLSRALGFTNTNKTLVDNEEYREQLKDDILNFNMKAPNTWGEAFDTVVNTLGDSFIGEGFKSIVDTSKAFLYDNAEIQAWNIANDVNEKKQQIKILTEEEFNNHPLKMEGQKYSPYLTEGILKVQKERRESEEKYEYLMSQQGWGELGVNFAASIIAGLPDMLLLGEVAGPIIGPVASVLRVGNKLKKLSTITKVGLGIGIDTVAAVGLGTGLKAVKNISREERGQEQLDLTPTLHEVLVAARTAAAIKTLYEVLVATGTAAAIKTLGYGIVKGIEKYQRKKNAKKSSTNRESKTSETENSAQNIRPIDEAGINDLKTDAIRDAQGIIDTINGKQTNKTFGKKSNEIIIDGETYQLPVIENYNGKDYGLDYRVVELDSLMENIARNVKKFDTARLKKNPKINLSEGFNEGIIPFISEAGEINYGNDFIQKLISDVETKLAYKDILSNIGVDTQGYQNPILIKRENTAVLQEYQQKATELKNFEKKYKNKNIETDNLPKNKDAAEKFVNRREGRLETEGIETSDEPISSQALDDPNVKASDKRYSQEIEDYVDKKIESTKLEFQERKTKHKDIISKASDMVACIFGK